MQKQEGEIPMKEGNPYIDQSVRLEPTGSGILDGLVFAVKDVFAITGHAASAGNPDWLDTHKAPEATAPAIEKLLGNGAAMEGVTITDELMYSINGENAHYGTPLNPAAPGRIPGGSSSGSASAVASCLADFALGTDTGGSVRVPSALCGLYGIRPTHGMVDTTGLIPLAPSFDTIGWIARDAATLQKVGEALFGPRSLSSDKPFQSMLLGVDLWELCEPETQRVLTDFLESWPPSFRLANKKRKIIVAEEGLPAWMDTFRHIQAIEAWEQHGDWISAAKPSFGPAIAERFQWASTLSRTECDGFFAKRQAIAERMKELLADDAILVVPTVPGAAPLCGLGGEAVEQNRARTLQLSCPAGLAGLPQVTVPVAGPGGLPVGLSFIAGRGQDRRLLNWLSN
jgi:amidase